jgi:replicative DNA helicase
MITPPVSLEAERAVLGNFLLEPGLLAGYVDTLPAALFWKDSSRWVWDAMCRLHHAGQMPDAITLAAELQRVGLFNAAGGHTYLAILQEEGTVATQLGAYIQLL